MLLLNHGTVKFKRELLLHRIHCTEPQSVQIPKSEYMFQQVYLQQNQLQQALLVLLLLLHIILIQIIAEITTITAIIIVITAATTIIIILLLLLQIKIPLRKRLRQHQIHQHILRCRMVCLLILQKIIHQINNLNNRNYEY